MITKASLMLLIPFILLSCTKPADPGNYKKLTRAMNLDYSGDHEEALQLFGQIYAEDPDFYENTKRYAQTLFNEGYRTEAISLWESIDQAINPDLDVIKRLSSYYLENRDYEKAGPLIDKGLRISSEDPLMLFLKARNSIAGGDMESALSFLLTSLTLMEQQIVIPLEIARIYSSYGLRSESVHMLRRFLQYLPEEHPLHSAVNNLLERERTDTE